MKTYPTYKECREVNKSGAIYKHHKRNKFRPVRSKSPGVWVICNPKDYQ